MKDDERKTRHPTYRNETPLYAAPAAAAPAEAVPDTNEAAAFWASVHPVGMTAEQVKAELSDYHFMLEQVPKVYEHVTGGRLTKPNYCASVVISAADDVVNDLVDEAVKEAAQPAEAPAIWDQLAEIGKDMPEQKAMTFDAWFLKYGIATSERQSFQEMFRIVWDAAVAAPAAAAPEIECLKDTQRKFGLVQEALFRRAEAAEERLQQAEELLREAQALGWTGGELDVRIDAFLAAQPQQQEGQ